MLLRPVKSNVIIAIVLIIIAATHVTCRKTLQLSNNYFINQLYNPSLCAEVATVHHCVREMRIITFATLDVLGAPLMHRESHVCQKPVGIPERTK